MKLRPNIPPQKTPSLDLPGKASASRVEKPTTEREGLGIFARKASESFHTAASEESALSPTDFSPLLSFKNSPHVTQSKKIEFQLLESKHDCVQSLVHKTTALKETIQEWESLRFAQESFTSKTYHNILQDTENALQQFVSQQDVLTNLFRDDPCFGEFSHGLSGFEKRVTSSHKEDLLQDYLHKLSNHPQFNEMIEKIADLPVKEAPIKGEHDEENPPIPIDEHAGLRELAKELCKDLARLKCEEKSRDVETKRIECQERLSFLELILDSSYPKDQAEQFLKSKNTPDSLKPLESLITALESKDKVLDQTIQDEWKALSTKEKTEIGFVPKVVHHELEKAHEVTLGVSNAVNVSTTVATFLNDGTDWSQTLGLFIKSSEQFSGFLEGLRPVFVGITNTLQIVQDLNQKEWTSGHQMEKLQTAIKTLLKGSELVLAAVSGGLRSMEGKSEHIPGLQAAERIVSATLRLAEVIEILEKECHEPRPNFRKALAISLPIMCGLASDILLSLSLLNPKEQVNVIPSAFVLMSINFGMTLVGVLNHWYQSQYEKSLFSFAGTCQPLAHSLSPLSPRNTTSFSGTVSPRGYLLLSDGSPDLERGADSSNTE
jgi:hypothetical protein